MLKLEVSPDFFGTSPLELAERASSVGHVLGDHMSFELLNPSKVFVAICTERPRPGALDMIMASPVLSFNIRHGLARRY